MFLLRLLWMGNNIGSMTGRKKIVMRFQTPFFMISPSLARRLQWVLRLPPLPLPRLLFLFLSPRKPPPLLLHIPRKRTEHPMHLLEHAGLERLARNEAPGSLQIAALDRHQVRCCDERLAAEEEDAAARTGDAHAHEQLDCFAQGLPLAHDQHVRVRVHVGVRVHHAASTGTGTSVLRRRRQYLVRQVCRIGTREHVRQSELLCIEGAGARPELGLGLGLGLRLEVR